MHTLNYANMHCICTCRDEAAQACIALAARRAHVDSMDAEADRLRAAAAVMRAQILEGETALARARGEADRHRAAALAAEQQVGLRF